MIRPTIPRIELLIIDSSPIGAKTTFRGARVPGHVQTGDLDELAHWKANLVSYPLLGCTSTKHPIGSRAYAEEYLLSVQAGVQACDELLGHCDELGIYMLITMRNPPGALLDDPASELHILYAEWARQLLMQAWELTVAQLRHHDSLFGFNLLESPPGAENGWRDLAEELSARIRKHDDSRWLVVEAPNGLPGSLSSFQPLPDERVIYSINMHDPMGYTHQLDPSNLQYVYPTKVGSRHWDAAGLEAILAPARNFQLKHSVRMMLGSFGAARWAQGSGRYMSDVIRIAERWGWDWIYREFRGENVWDVERGVRAEAPRLVFTDKKKILRNHMARNSSTWGRRARA